VDKGALGAPKSGSKKLTACRKVAGLYWPGFLLSSKDVPEKSGGNETYANFSHARQGLQESRTPTDHPAGRPPSAGTLTARQSRLGGNEQPNR
jgi:hypothetical protein